ncbi:hypothetical protein PIIN_08162 [Serendipita indica DSM 11827]|uniref:Secreted protein n=1 Tax=Serendipita indica (strain DSM 11827) TaxID=1109443 RepID=G4TSB6_SERID|nr:hypothetical protein PIIN_08162 [Serendipita indica DSM 11827]
MICKAVSLACMIILNADWSYAPKTRIQSPSTTAGSSIRYSTGSQRHVMLAKPTRVADKNWPLLATTPYT